MDAGTAGLAEAAGRSLADPPFDGVLSYWLLQTVAMLITVALIPRLRVTGIFGATLTVAALALVNATIWDGALFFSVPDAVTTHALVLLTANGLIFWLLVKLLPGIETDGILASIAAPVVFTFVSLVVDRYGRAVDWIAVIQWAIGALETLRDALMDARAPDSATDSLP